MSEKSIWENLGRGVGFGWRKVKEVGAQLNEQAETRLDLREARERMERALTDLGRIVCRTAIEEQKPHVDLGSEEIRSLIREVRDAHAQVERIEAAIEKEGEKEDERPRGAGPQEET